MSWLVTGMILLIGIHLVPSFPALRRRLVNMQGMTAYQAGFGLIALLGLVLIAMGFSGSQFTLLWQPPAWGRLVNLVLMVPALILLVAAYLPSNIKRYTRHPMLWGVVIWSIGHLLSNGDTASLILFGGLGLFALFDMLSANLRGARKQQQAVSAGHETLVVSGGIIAYLALLYLHPLLFGVSAI